MKYEIKNRVSESKLVTIDFNDFLTDLYIEEFDIKPWLKDDLILIEKEFRKNVRNFNWSLLKGKNISIICSNSAIIPDWAFMLVSSELTKCGIENFIGNIKSYKEYLINHKINDLDLSSVLNKPVIIKGCSDDEFSKFIYSQLIQKIQGVVSSIMFGEACSAVPIFKKQ